MAKKYKRMSVREKEERKRIKKQLQAEGIIPQDKPRLNRKKFACEVCEEWKAFSLSNFDNFMAFEITLALMTNSGRFRAISKEDLGILKLKKCAMVLAKAIEGEDKNLHIDEMVELIKPIWDL